MINNDDIRSFKSMQNIYLEQAKKVKSAIDEVLYDTNEENIVKMIKVIQRGPHLNEDDIETVAEAAYETYWEEQNT